MPLKSFKQFTESGNAIKGLSRINQENVDATLQDVYKKLLPVLKIKKGDTTLLGSTGKKLPGGSSGDVDLGIGLSAIMKAYNTTSFGDLADVIVAKLEAKGLTVKDSRGLGIITVDWPIANVDGNQEDQFVQLDMMFVDNLKYSSWAFYSPHEKDSKYKGVYRMKAMAMILRHVDNKILEKLVEDGKDIPVKWQSHIIDLSRGVFKVVKDKTGKRGLLKKAKTIDKKFISNDPLDIVHIMLGPDFTLADADSFETLWKAINSPKFIHKKNVSAIKSDIKQAMVEAGLPLDINIK